MKKSDLLVMQEMAAANMDIQMCPEVVSMKTVKAGGEIAFGVPDNLFKKVAIPATLGAQPEYYLAFYVINKKQFDEIKNQPTT